jgi:hypothetical protein
LLSYRRTCYHTAALALVPPHLLSFIANVRVTSVFNVTDWRRQHFTSIPSSFQDAD